MDPSRQDRTPIMVDISTGEEYLNGVLIRPEPEPPLEVVLFKFRQNPEASLPPNYLGNSRCDLTECYCDATAVVENAHAFCQALRQMAECRGRMCAYTIDALLKDELFNVLFEWIEIGDMDPREGHGEVTSNSRSVPSNNSNNEPRQGTSSSSSSRHSDERLPQEEVVSNEFSPISSTTSPPAHVPGADDQNGNTSTSNSAQRSSVNTSSSGFAWAGVRLKNRALELASGMDVNEDNTSSEPEISQVHNESRESDENSGVVEPVPDAVSSNTSPPELPSTTGVENQMCLTPEQAVNEEPEPETRDTSSHHQDDSSSPPECPTISDCDAQAAAGAVPNVPDASPAGDVTSVSSSLLQSDKNAIQGENEAVPRCPVVEKVVEPPNVPKSNSEDSRSGSFSTIAKSKSDLNTQTPTPKPPGNETDSQPPEQPRRHWEENEGIGKGLPSKLRKSSFDSSGDCARVRQWLEMQYTSELNISDVQENDDQSPSSDVESEPGEELEEGEIDSQEDVQQAEETQPKKTEAPVDKTLKSTISSEKRITRSGNNSPVPFQSPEEGMRTRSRSSVPGPASAKRDRESRAAKKSAQSKISSMLGAAPETTTNEGDKEASNSTKDSTPAAGRKRSRNSETAANQSNETETVNQHQTRSTVNKNSLSRRKRARILPDENSSDVPSCSSRSSTPTLDESNHHTEINFRQERRNSSSPAPVATRHSQRILEKPQTRTSNEKTSTEERMITNTEDSGSSDSDDSSSSDSGESHVSEIPLAQRLEKKRKREDKERRKSLKGNKTSDEARARKSERKRKKKQGLSLNLTKPGSSSTLQSKLPFRIPELPTNAKKAEALISSTLAILQATKPQNLPPQQQNPQVETTPEEVVTINDDDDDDILMVEEVEVAKKTASTCAKSTSKRSSSTEGSSSTGKITGIHISLNKDKSKGLTPQRSLSIPGTSPANVPDSTSPPGSTRIEFGKQSLGKSASLPLTISTPDELHITPSSEVDLEDHSRWEFPQKTSPRKTPQISVSLINPKTNEPVHQDKPKSQQINSLASNQSMDLIIINEKELATSKEPTGTLSKSQKPAETLSTSKKATETASTSKKSTETTSTSKDPKAASSLPNKAPSSIPSSLNQKGSSENVKQVSPSKNASDDQASRNLRARSKVAFDPKAEAAKPIPKPVPKVTKEIIMQQQVSKSTPAPAPSSSISKTATVTNAASSTPQKESSSLPSKSKESTAQPTPQKTPGKSQQQQQNKPGSSESTARKESVESASPSKVSSTSTSAQQRDRSRSPQVTPKSKPTSTAASFTDGEIRLIPSKPSTSGSTSSTSPSGRTGGTWRRAGPTDNRREQEIDFTDDSVDFETRPDDEDDRRRSSSKNRERNRSGASSRSSSSSSGGGNRNYRGGSGGGGHQQPYRFQGPPRGGGGGPPRQFFDGGGRGHPRSRPPFNGGPRANMINTVLSHGRYQNPEDFSQDFLPGMPHPNQFPPSLMEMQFNPQFGPPPGMYPMMGGPRPPFFHNQQFPGPPRWPRYRM